MDRFNLNLSLDEINLILTALGKQPAETVYDVITSVRGQTQVQIGQQQEAFKTPVSETEIVLDAQVEVQEEVQS